MTIDLAAVLIDELSFKARKYEYVASCEVQHLIDLVASLTAERDAAVAAETERWAAFCHEENLEPGTTVQSILETAIAQHLEIAKLTAERDAMRAVVEAAKKWRGTYHLSHDKTVTFEALVAAIDALAEGET